MSTQRTNPSIPLPSIVKHACTTASIAAAITNGFVDRRRFAAGSFAGECFITLFLIRRFYNKGPAKRGWTLLASIG